MKVTIFKKDKESNERAISRFNKVVQASRKLLLVRDERYHARKPTRIKIRAAAIKRDFHRAQREKNKFY